MKKNKESIGAQPYQYAVAQGIPTTPIFQGQRPTIFRGTPLAGNTVYYLLNSLFDPRSAAATTGAVEGFSYSRYCQVTLQRMLFEANPGRAIPNNTIVNVMLDQIADIGRMVGLYLTAFATVGSGDSTMYDRADACDFLRNFGSMQVSLSRLPIPPNVLTANLKYIGLMNTSSGQNFANVGYLVAGDFTAFRNLRNIVEGGETGTAGDNRREALRWLNTLYPLIGQIGDKGTGYSADVMEAFINSHRKTATSGDAYVPYTSVAGATDEPAQLMAGGLLQLVQDGTSVFTQTRFAVPGSGITNSTAPTLNPGLCTFDRNANRDAFITRTTATTNYAAATGTPQMLLNASLAENLAYEYDMGVTDTTAANQPITFPANLAGLATAHEALAANNPRYRGNEGRSLDGLSFRLDQNTEALIGSMLDN